MWDNCVVTVVGAHRDVSRLVLLSPAGLMTLPAVARGVRGCCGCCRRCTSRTLAAALPPDESAWTRGFADPAGALALAAVADLRAMWRTNPGARAAFWGCVANVSLSGLQRTVAVQARARPVLLLWGAEDADVPTALAA